MLMAILRNLFQTKKQRRFDGLLAEALATKPPPLPAARIEYVLYRSRDGLFDIKDGIYIVGSLAQQEEDEEQGGYWEASVHSVSFLSFKSFNDATQWLGNPPVRTYR